MLTRPKVDLSKRPLISVVIPTYNHAHYLGRALESVKQQTYAYWEVIIVDNHSQDNTDQVVREFNDPRFHLLKIHNAGVIAASRNKGVRAAKGEWIAFLDSDDWWTPDKLAISVRATGGNLDVIYHDLKVVKQLNQKIHLRRVRSRVLSGNAYDDLLSNGPAMPNSSVVVRRESLIEVGGISEDKDKIAWEDFDTWISLAKAGCQFRRVRGSHGYYWFGGGNVTNANRTLATVSSFIRHHIDQSTQLTKNNIPWWCHYTLALTHQQLGDLKQSRDHFVKAWKLVPSTSNRLLILYKWFIMSVSRARSILNKKS